jgi:uncharacterized protein YfdQ (DUF2303 family)
MDPRPTQAPHHTASMLALGAALAGVQNAHGRQFVLVPQADGSSKLEFVEPMSRPVRVLGDVTAYDVASFCDYVNRHSDRAASLIYAKLTPAAFICVLNDHGKGTPGWRDHRCTFMLEHSPEYLAWHEQDGKQMGQREFMEFIEEQLVDFVTPTGAKMYELATNFKVHSQAKFNSGITQSNGSVKFEYTEVVEGGAGRTGNLEVPEEFKITIPVWAGLAQKKYAFGARLRFRLQGGVLSFLYALDRPAKVVEQAFADTLEAIKTKAKDVPVLFGAPGK